MQQEKQLNMCDYIILSFNQFPGSEKVPILRHFFHNLWCSFTITAWYLLLLLL